MSTSAAADRELDLRELVRTSEIIVCTGSGGVGKTTIAAVLALEGALLGRRACVVTIDPAKRLADALGLARGGAGGDTDGGAGGATDGGAGGATDGGAGLTNEPRRIEGSWPGELWAMMLDTKSTFDDLVVKHAADEEQAQGILENRFYRNISGALSGTQEYMAMEKLYELHEESDFDLVVVDTPPTRNALDFLEAPRHLSRFLDHRLYRMLTVPTRGVVRAVNVAAQAFLRTVSKVVGGDVVRDAITFFQAFDGMEQGFKERAQRVTELLAAEPTRFVLVASPRRDTVEEAGYFAEKLAEAGLTVRALVINRLHPRFGDGRPELTRERGRTYAGTALGGLYENLADFQQVASKEEEHLAGLAQRVPRATLVRVPYLRSDVHDIDGMAEVARHLFHE